MSNFVQYLLTLDYSYPLNIGERALAINIARALKNINPAFQVICRQNNVQESGYDITKVKSVRIEYIDTIRIVYALNNLNYEQGIVHLININYALALPLLRKRWGKKVKLIPYFYMLDHSKYLKGPRGYLKSNMAPKISSKFADLAIATSPLISVRLKKLGLKNVYHVYPPIDTQVFKPLDKDNARKEFKRLFNNELNFGNTDLTLVYMGHLTQERFPYISLLKMLKKLIKMNVTLNFLIFTPKLPYNIEYSKHLLKTAKDLEIKKYISLQVKNLNTKEKVIVYNTADIFIYPAQKPAAVDPPLTLLEAQSCGIPSIVTSVQSIPYIIRNYENGFLLNQLSDFLKVIKRLSRYDQLETIRENARHTAVANYSMNTIRNIFDRLINHIVS